MRQVIARWEGGYRTRVQVRQFEVTADEPVEEGGTDTAPRPTELLLAAQAACFVAALHHVAGKRGLALPADLVVRVSGEYAGPRFRRLRTDVSGGLPRSELERLVRDARAYCWVSNTLRGGAVLEFAVSAADAATPAAG